MKSDLIGFRNDFLFIFVGRKALLMYGINACVAVLHATYYITYNTNNKWLRSYLNGNLFLAIAT